MFKLNYKGDLSDQHGVVMGPNLLGEYLEVKNQVYDPQTDQTTLLLSIYRIPSE